MQRIAVVSKPQKSELLQLMPELVLWLRERNFEPVLDRESASYLESLGNTTMLAGQPVMVLDRPDMPQAEPVLIIVLGGDGTLLAVGRIFAHLGTPLLSVNLGSLGFLTEVRLSDLYRTLEGWCHNCCTMDVRTMLHGEVWRGGARVASFEAVNDMVLAKGAIARMGEFGVELDGMLAARFRADGVIVSTPTGSTAYTLAANGPILVPGVDALVITPICPHLLTLRPMVVPGNSALTLRVEGPKQSFATPTLLTVDGQQAVELQLADELRCHRSEHTVTLIRLGENGFFDVLRSKLKWGER